LVLKSNFKIPTNVKVAILLMSLLPSFDLTSLFDAVMAEKVSSSCNASSRKSSEK